MSVRIVGGKIMGVKLVDEAECREMWKKMWNRKLGFGIVRARIRSSDLWVMGQRYFSCVMDEIYVELNSFRC